MKTTIFGTLVGVFMSIVCGIAAAQAEIKVGIADSLSGADANAGEQTEMGALKAIAHLNDKGGLLRGGCRHFSGRCVRAAASQGSSTATGERWCYFRCRARLFWLFACRQQHL